jgi:hypothetical protein
MLFLLQNLKIKQGKKHSWNPVKRQFYKQYQICYMEVNVGQLQEEILYKQNTISCDEMLRESLA